MINSYSIVTLISNEIKKNYSVVNENIQEGNGWLNIVHGRCLYTLDLIETNNQIHGKIFLSKLPLINIGWKARKRKYKINVLSFCWFDITSNIEDKVKDLFIKLKENRIIRLW